jgi:SPP1 gp7 family putative phage head morphogenesis protein
VTNSRCPASGSTLRQLHGEGIAEPPTSIAREILPAVQNVQASARRIARTESLRVAAAVQMEAHAGLGSLVVGYRINATLDKNTRPEHRARDGTAYYAHPQGDQLGYDQMPRPPQESDGSMAWNCRCWLSPLIRG